MTPAAFLGNAERMLVDYKGSLDKSRCRAIVHAAYYSVFHLSAERLNVPTTGPDAVKHADLVRLIQANPKGDRAIAVAKRNIRSLKHARQEADYVLGAAVGADSAEDCVDWAFEVFDAAGITPTAE